MRSIRHFDLSDSTLRRTACGKLVFGFLFFSLGAVPVAGDFEIVRFTNDGGGVVLSEGEGYTLSGTIGQPDAAVSDGDGYQLSGGFWFAEPLGDCDASGIADLLDHADLVECLDGPDAPLADDTCACFDFDEDENIDLADFATFSRVYMQ